MIRSQTLIPLTSGSYTARSKLADYQVSENLFCEIDPAETTPDVPMTLYPREGKRALSAPPVAGPGRGVFTLSNGRLFAIVGAAVYFIDQNWKWNLLGQISNLTTPVSMSDNGVTAVLVDGTPKGYTITLQNNVIVFAPLVDPTGLFVGSNRVDFSDTFLAFAAPGTNEWYVTLSDQVAFNFFAQANKDSTPDPIQTFAFNIRQAWLLGTQNSEVWFNAGGTPFPYQEWPNIFVPYGCAAIYSLVRADIDLFWMSENAQGQAIAVKTNGYAVEAISTRALEYEWSGYPTIADCIGGTFQQGGHTFIIFSFPIADKCWGYDLATKQWHERTYRDQNGVAHRDKATFFAAVGAPGGYPATIVGQDWATGQIYALDPKTYTDNGVPIVCRRTFPHIMADMKEITHVSFVADFETGGITEISENPPTHDWSPDFGPDFQPGLSYSQPFITALCMRYSNNGGGSFGNYRQKKLASSGHYRSMMRWRGLGMARDRVYELLWAYPGPSALQGAYIEPLGHSA